MAPTVWRVERGVRVLEDHLDVATDLPEVLLLEVRDVAALELDLAGGGSVEAVMSRAVVDLPQPDSPTRPRVWPWMVQFDPVDGLDRRLDHLEALHLTEREAALEVGDLEQRLVGDGSVGSAAGWSVCWSIIEHPRRSGAWPPGQRGGSGAWRLARPGVGRNSGSTVQQASPSTWSLKVQRGWNEQPGGRLSRLGGAP